MKVLHIINGLDVGGAETFLLRLLEGFSSLPMTNSVLTLTPRDTLRKDFESTGTKVDLLQGRPTDFLALRKAIKAAKPDVIHSWLYHSILATELATLTIPFDKPAVFWGIHHTVKRLELEKWKTRQVIRLLRRFSSRPRKIIYVSNSGRQQHEDLGFDASKSCVVPNGYNTEKFCNDPQSRLRIRQELGASENDFLIGIVARFNPVKDHACFLDAAGYCAEKLPNAKFVLVGRDVTDSNHDLMDQIRTLKLEDRCKLLGERSDIGCILNGLDLLASSSLSEAFPIVVGEAMSSETPVAVTDVGDSAFLVGDQSLVVPPSRPKELASVWTSIALMPKSERVALGKMLRARIVGNFSIESVSNRYYQLYSSSDNPMKAEIQE